MRAVKSVSIDSERRVIITFLDGSTETLYPNCIWCDSEALRQLIKDLLEEKADAIVQTINNVTIASFADGADEALIRKLLVSIDPIQEGTGDPSPDNVRPISGRTGLSVVRTGKNLCPVYDRIAGAYWGTVSEELTNFLNTLKPGTYTLKNKFRIEELPTNSENVTHAPAYIRVHVNGQYSYLNSYRPVTDDSPSVGKIYQESTTITITEEVKGHITEWNLYCDSSVHTGTGRGKYYLYDIFIEKGSSDIDYEPYKSNIYSVKWETVAGTVYGGYVDVVSGKLAVDRGYIASYNGEALPSTWISDRDVYSEGTAPTTGAEVVYKLADPIEYQIDAQDITTLLGTNNIWTDSGNILELEYVADTKLYIGESQSGTLGSGRQAISNTDLQPVTEKSVEDLSEAVKAETIEKETHEETEDERGE